MLLEGIDRTCLEHVLKTCCGGIGVRNGIRTGACGFKKQDRLWCGSRTRIFAARLLSEAVDEPGVLH